MCIYRPLCLNKYSGGIDRGNCPEELSGGIVGGMVRGNCDGELSWGIVLGKYCPGRCPGGK